MDNDAKTAAKLQNGREWLNQAVFECRTMQVDSHWMGKWLNQAVGFKLIFRSKIDGAQYQNLLEYFLGYHTNGRQLTRLQTLHPLQTSRNQKINPVVCETLR